MAEQNNFYRPELDVVRFLAFLLVFLHHGLTNASGLLKSFAISGGFGMCLFFLLSSYLITELLEREDRSSGKIHLKSFYVRRILRIWPLYFAILVLDFVVQRARHYHSFPAGCLLSYLFLAGNWYTAIHGFSQTLSTPLWSISVEEQFYVIWPSVRKWFRRSGAISFSIAMLVVSFTALTMLARQHADAYTAIWVNSFVQFQFFSSGALLSILLNGRDLNFSTPTRLCLGLFALAALFCAEYVFHARTGTPASSPLQLCLGYLLVNLGCIAVLLAFLGASRLGRFPWLLYCGKITYGLYVFHWMMLRFAMKGLRGFEHRISLGPLSSNILEMTIALVFTFAAAHLSYRFFESPFLRLKRKFEFVRTRAV